MSTAPAEVVQQYLEAAFVRHDLDAIKDLVTSDALVSAARGFVSAFPDIEMRFEHTATENDWVASGVSASGTHLGAFQGHPPTGKHWEARATAWYQVTNGKISSAWIVWDWLPIMQAVGAVGDTDAGTGSHP